MWCWVFGVGIVSVISVGCWCILFLLVIYWVLRVFLWWRYRCCFGVVFRLVGVWWILRCWCRVFFIRIIFILFIVIVFWVWFGIRCGFECFLRFVIESSCGVWWSCLLRRICGVVLKIIFIIWSESLLRLRSCFWRKVGRMFGVCYLVCGGGSGFWVGGFMGMGFSI